MKYLTFVLEDNNIQHTINNNGTLIELASNQIQDVNILIETYIHENLVEFVANSENAQEVYENICNFVITENLRLYSQLSEILADSKISDDDKFECLTEGWQQIKDLFTQAAKTPIKQRLGELFRGHAAVTPKGSSLLAGGMKQATSDILGSGGQFYRGTKIGAGVAGAGIGGTILHKLSEDPSQPISEPSPIRDTIGKMFSKHPYATLGGVGIIGGAGAYHALKPKKQNE